MDRSSVLSCPLPRSLELIFTPARLAELRARYKVVETTDEALPLLADAVLAQARYIIGQPPLDAGTIAELVLYFQCRVQSAQ